MRASSLSCLALTLSARHRRAIPFKREKVLLWRKTKAKARKLPSGFDSYYEYIAVYFWNIGKASRHYPGRTLFVVLKLIRLPHLHWVLATLLNPS